MSEFTIASPVRANSATLAGRWPVVDRIAPKTVSATSGQVSHTFSGRHGAVIQVGRISPNVPTTTSPAPTTPRMSDVRNPPHSVRSTSIG